jgi:hypothetical protein
VARTVPIYSGASQTVSSWVFRKWLGVIVQPRTRALCGTTRYQKSWKTSLGIFVCHALGVDPVLHIVDCGTETGKSVAVRRGGTGAAVFERHLLQAPFVTFDEFLTASPEVRAALGLFLGDRLTVAFENEQLTVHPVSFLTLNPRAKPTLEQQIGLSAPQIRRAILVNLDAVSMPDLAVTGERALEAARAHPPLALGAPVVDCGAFHDRVVDLVRAVLLPEAHARVDVEVVINLATGMTAFMTDPAEAIAQVGYDLGVLAETLGWTRAGWIQTVTDFSLTPGKTAPVMASAAAPTTALAKNAGDPATTTASTSSDTFPLAVAEPVRRIGHVPDLALREATLMRLVWFAHETDRDTDGAVDLLLDFYLEWRGNEKAIETIEAILDLARELQMAELDVETLHDYLADRQSLAQHNCSFADLPEALQVLDLLSQLPIEWDWERATTAMQAVADVLQAGIAVEKIGAFLARHQRLDALGFADTAEALASALSAAGVVGDQQGAVIRQLVKPGKALADHEALDAASARLQADVAQLEARKAQLDSDLGALAGRWDGLCREVHAGQAALAEVTAERAMKAGDLDVLQALRGVLRGKTAAAEAFFADLRTLDRWRQAGGTLEDRVGATYVKGLSEKLIAFFQQLLQEAQGKS